ncbi:hypothetical protein OIU84_022000 [Salix udensis]|uniref:Uncharacterized protein n=1 Tax=Salix udensis TaxID=889485 RepID=A0AAD6J661_9ROSI|nr:hypothetical protein OIU84_022000 [Salix udensis]
MPHDIKKLTESQEGSSENARFSKPLLEALIHLETFLPQPKQIDYLDWLDDKFILTRSDSVHPASASEREELSCIFLEAAYTGNAYGTDSTYIVPDGHVEAAFGTEAVVGTDSTINNAAVTENASFVSPQAAGYDSAVDGNTSTEAGVVLSDENGNAGEVVGGADAVQQFEDGSVPEIRDRESGWDHEARLGFMDKVVEVYERAVLGVTSSVDIWLHYCIFVISMYEDPETIIRVPS